MAIANLTLRFLTKPAGIGGALALVVGQDARESLARMAR